MMRTLFVLGTLLLAASTVAARPADDLRLTITLTRGERSEDSRASECKITINGTAVTYDITYPGSPTPENQPQPQHRTVTLTNDEVKNLKKLAEQHRWQTGIEKREFNGPDTINYFSITVAKGSGSSEKTLLITGMPRHPLVRPDPFIFADKLLVEVFRILHERDPEIVYFSVID